MYAVLLGSGASRAARIPTGWDITLELVRKVAALEGADCGVDPSAWFLTAKGKVPDYSELLDKLARTPTERQQLLRPYWEPTEQERDEGAKLPTKAHRAIADLVKLGYIRVILTTNFDRLLETALHDVGIQPTVLSTPDQIDGALPLIHTPCTIVKIHGDYLDTRIRNTPEELAEYPEHFNKLLDRIFDEFGLIVSGWSADWDEALRAAMTRAPYRRFSAYWASRGEPSEKAADLIARKGAVLIKIADADSFFVSLSEKIKALEEFARPHPLSTEAAVATMKTYLSEPKYRIALDDLVGNEVERLTIAVSGPAFDASECEVSGATVERRLEAYDLAAETLIRMAFVAGRWAEGVQLLPWVNAIAKLASRRALGGVVTWLELQSYPATVVLYGFGLGALLGNRMSNVGHLLNVVIKREHREAERAVERLALWAMFEYGPEIMSKLPGRERRHTPLNERLAEMMSRHFLRFFPSDSAFGEAFDKLEVIVSLSFAKPLVETDKRYWAPPGMYGWRSESRRQIFGELRKDLTDRGDSSDLVTSGIVGRSAEVGLRNLDKLEEFLGSLRWH